MKQWMAMGCLLSDPLLVNGDTIGNIKLLEDSASNQLVIVKHGRIYKNAVDEDKFSQVNGPTQPF
jgi:hypothetical protein